MPVPPVGRARALPARARGRVPRAGNPDRSEREALEDELKDSRTFVDYFLPRPIRVVLLGGSAASCLVGTGLTLLGDGGACVHRGQAWLLCHTRCEQRAVRVVSCGACTADAPA